MTVDDIENIMKEEGWHTVRSTEDYVWIHSRALANIVGYLKELEKRVKNIEDHLVKNNP